jgi:hypothetical protein
MGLLLGFGSLCVRGRLWLRRRRRKQPRGE